MKTYAGSRVFGFTRVDGALNRSGERFQNEAVLVTGFTKELKQLRQRRQQQRQKTIGFKTKTTTLQLITLFSIKSN